MYKIGLYIKMQKTYIKYIDDDQDAVINEVNLQKIASEHGLAPIVIYSDYESYIVMEKIDGMNLADKYGDKMRNIPRRIRNQILDILWELYTYAGIEYVDVTPYNFIEKDGIVWIIDFGHARIADEDMDPYLAKIFTSWKLSWNPKFK